jgi:hypothetical protein
MLLRRRTHDVDTERDHVARAQIAKRLIEASRADDVGEESRHGTELVLLGAHDDAVSARSNATGSGMWAV